VLALRAEAYVQARQTEKGLGVLIDALETINGTQEL
jgi:hypothetical protein